MKRITGNEATTSSGPQRGPEMMVGVACGAVMLTIGRTLEKKHAGAELTAGLWCCAALFQRMKVLKY